MRLRLFLPLLAIMTAPLVSTELTAQVVRTSGEQTNVQRGQFVDGILRTLVDSRKALNPVQPLSPTTQGRASQQVQSARRGLRDFANETGQLITALRYEERYASYVKTLLGDAFTVKATADVLAQRSLSITDAAQLSSEYAELDRQWRLLSYQLQQTANVSNTVSQRVTRLNEINEELSKQLKLTPQMQQDDLVFYFAALSEDLKHLAEDIQIDLYAHPKRDEYRQQLLQLQRKSQQLRLAVENQYPYADVARYYKQFHAEWLPLKGELRTVQNRYIQRNISRLTQINDRVHELLWLAPVIDGRDILYQADALRLLVDQVAGNISLQQLIQLPNATDVFNKSKQFYAMCSDFRQTVSVETQLDNVRWDFRVLDVAWSDLKSEMDLVDNPDSIQDIVAIDNSIMELRRSLGLQPSVDYGQSLELASTLHNLSDLLFYDINRNVGRSSQYSAQFRNQAVRLSDRFHKTTGQLHESLMNREGNEPRIRQLTGDLAQQWNELQQVISQIPHDQQGELIRTSQHIAPAMAKLQVIHGY